MATNFVPSKEQLDSLSSLRESLIRQDKLTERHTDSLLFRFLRARKFDLDKTEKMLVEADEWRIATSVEDTVENFSYPEADQVSAYYPRYYHKTDKLGRTVYIEVLKNLDVTALFQVTTHDRFITRHVRDFEKFTRYRLAACSAKAGRLVEQGTSILDLKGVPLGQFNQVRKVIQSISSIASNYYPEHMGKLVIINSPILFTAIWAVIKTMLDEATVAKISIIGTNYQKPLLELIAAEDLPVFLGGCDKADKGPWNDGTVEGFPQSFWEDFRTRDISK